MRQILITGDDGPDATGLKVLRDAAQQAYPSSRIIQITTATQQSGKSFSCSDGWERWKTIEPTLVGKDTYTYDLTPGDVLTRAFLIPDPITDRPWDLVLTGVNHGSNVGLDVYLSATVSMAMMAASFYATPAIAFSQDLPDASKIFDAQADRRLFNSADRALLDILRRTNPSHGDCFNVNFPVTASMGFKATKVAHYSRYRTPPTSMVPRAEQESSDVTHLAQGYVTVSQLQLRVNPPHAF